jgi:signal peptidase II
MEEPMKFLKYFLLAFGVIVLDQVSKLLVYNNMYLHEEINVIGEWFRLHYLLNPGMAFGIKWENEFGKLTLSVFRIAAMFGIGYYLVKMGKKGAHPGFLWCMGLILGGAVGNVIDSTFYGVFLGNSPEGSPTPWFHGQVIDMLFFPLFEFMWPAWVPSVGGEYFLFFSPVFNIADSSIFIGVLLILIYQKKFFKHHHEAHEELPTGENNREDISSSEGEVENRQDSIGV